MSNAMSKKVGAPQRSQEIESLVKRMAGPSSGKAGLAKDQTEINRIIMEASKGSKFYENEKKKDRELTTRIERILKQRDEAVQGADFHKVESAVDQLLIQLEAQRDLTQIIVHVDMDAFYANVELLDKPELNGKAFAVGRGVLTTASYEARKYGVRSGMAGFIAKKLCPGLILLQNRFSRYSEMSEKVMEIFHRYDPGMCPAGCDEGYLNISTYCEEHSLTAEECVQQMRETVFLETKLTVSAGIAPNKMLAKICSDKNKPNGQFQLQFDCESIKAFMQDLPIRKVPGIGRVNERLLDAVGIKTCGDIFGQRAIVSLLDKQFGLVFLMRTYLGIASNTVRPHEREERKSIGAERTFSTLGKREQIFEKLSEVAIELEKDMEENGWIGRTVTLKFKLDTYQVFTRAKSLDHWVSKKEELFAIGKELLLPELPLKLRLIGLRVTKLKDLRDTTPTNGIKRFFESSKDNDSRKRAKLDVLDSLAEESMPGYHEHDETDLKLEAHDLEVDDDITEIEPQPESARPHRPASNAKPSSSKLQIAPSKPQVKSELEDSLVSPKKKGLQLLVCPICIKTLETDNSGLNAHIDFCLSRGEIMKAQVETNQTTKKQPDQYKGWPKPPSIKKVETRSPSTTKNKRPKK